MRLAQLLALPALALVAACSGSATPTGSNGSPPPPGATLVSIQDFTFSPASVTIKVGQTVSWTNHGPSNHTTTSDAGAWDSATLSASGGTFSKTFNTAGTYPYHCKIHPPATYPGFTGTITVTQ